jgi:hypothetical protein
MASLNKGIVIAFGRFNPPTTGHALLIDLIKREAAKRKADVLIFPSQTQDTVTLRTRVAPKNPLPFLEKVDFLEELFPDVNFSDNVSIKTPGDALMACSQAGYDRVWVTVGSDRAADFMSLGKYVKPKGLRGQDIILKEYGVIVVPANRDPDAEGVAGMSASKMRAAALENDFKAFQKGVPTKRLDIAQRLFKSVQKHMGLREAVQRGFLLYGPKSLAEAVKEYTTMTELTPRDITLNSPRFVKELSSKRPVAIDVTNESYVTVHHLHRLLESVGIVPTVYVYTGRARLVSEDTVQQMTTAGLIRRGLARDVVEVATAGRMIQDMISIMEGAYGRHECPKCEHVWWGVDLKSCPSCGAKQPNTGGHPPLREEGEPKPAALKTPTEVDHLKATQKQQEIALKSRQAQEILAAKQRELAKKTRDTMNKIKTGEKPTATAEK